MYTMLRHFRFSLEMLFSFCNLNILSLWEIDNNNLVQNVANLWIRAQKRLSSYPAY